MSTIAVGTPSWITDEAIFGGRAAEGGGAALSPHHSSVDGGDNAASCALPLGCGRVRTRALQRVVRWRRIEGDAGLGGRHGGGRGAGALGAVMRRLCSLRPRRRGVGWGTLGVAGARCAVGETGGAGRGEAESR
eukprot:GFKZ01007613.1.p1 GENE.GFKZ01007613.1~~GFKZ01007613.1.p1  ORF type:complete len:134 (-),score=8.35 GFKZ01007613.1:33-434(-)